MKNHIIISLLFLSVGLSQKEYDINHIVEQNNVYIKKFSDEIVNGKVFQMFGDMKVPLGKMKDGKKEGKWIYWYPNGQKKSVLTYKDEKLDGLFTIWYENGQKKVKRTYKDGEPDGLETKWYENGQKRLEETWKDGEWISEKEWDEDGSDVNYIYDSWYGYTTNELTIGWKCSFGRTYSEWLEVSELYQSYYKIITIEGS